MTHSPKRARFVLVLLLAVAGVSPYAAANPISKVGSGVKSVAAAAGHATKTVLVKSAHVGSSVVNHVRSIF